ncbi:glycoside hydrolase family 24 protein [Paraburkholderia fungorum]|uniref:glycoside hydrolase family 24 protein n=1 Tax=Paraburkholderia fungorum TaxID=134537 RepID=UPI0020969272|nr:glycoside hydrolase family 104 protein [Paraburkholderia fungorum]USX03825.1 glycoside hydrolase family 104 protein [Paraburkholderia fungorum]
MKGPGPLYIIAAGTLAAAAYVWWTNSQALSADTGGDGTDGSAGDTSGFTGIFSDMTSSISNAFTSVAGAVNDPNVRAFLSMIRVGEGTAGPNGYTTFFGGSQFSDLSKHPNVAHTAGGYTSTAAGAYQFLYSTWQQIAAQYGLTDFSPASQDIGAVALIKQDGALADVLAGRIATAIGKCNRTWASLAGSPYGQPTLTMADDLANYVNAGGNLTDGTVTA